MPGRPGDHSPSKKTATILWPSYHQYAGFLTEAVYDVQHRLRERGCGLLVRFGYPEDVVVNLVKALEERGDEIVAFEMQKEVSTFYLLISMEGIELCSPS